MKASKTIVGLKEKDPCSNMSQEMSYASSVSNNQFHFNPSLKFKQAFSKAEYLWALDFCATHAHVPAIQRLCADIERGLATVILAHRQLRAH